MRKRQSTGGVLRRTIVVRVVLVVQCRCVAPRLAIFPRAAEARIEESDILVLAHFSPDTQLSTFS